MLELILFLVIALPVAWLISEFQHRAWLRISLGLCALLISFGLAWASGVLARLDDNIWYGTLNKDIVANTIHELEKGRTEAVLEGLKELRSKYQPTYENRADFDQHVERYINAISEEPIRHKPGVPGWYGE